MEKRSWFYVASSPVRLQQMAARGWFPKMFRARWGLASGDASAKYIHKAALEPNALSEMYMAYNILRLEEHTLYPVQQCTNPSCLWPQIIWQIITNWLAPFKNQDQTFATLQSTESRKMASVIIQDTIKIFIWTRADPYGSAYIFPRCRALLAAHLTRALRRSLKQGPTPAKAILYVNWTHCTLNKQAKFNSGSGQPCWKIWWRTIPSLGMKCPVNWPSLRLDY